MLKITFYPESDLLDFTQAVKEYENIWAEKGTRIVEVYERISGKTFKETYVNAVVGNTMSKSHPLTFRYNYENDAKEFTLVHELGHRLLVNILKKENKNSLTVHQLLNTIYYDVCLELYGHETTSKIIRDEKNYDAYREESVYTKAWDWLLKLKSFEERQAKFKEILATGEVAE